MSDRLTPFVQAVVVAIVVLGGLLPAGYFALNNLEAGLDAKHTQTRKVVIDLKTETVTEIRAVRTAAA